ncbi:MAG: hypothetical protein AUI15_12370 [Actinobacteria bacterium 13_2_20CM_2_66_6]|nr:MAG: hypothetical protein AUI15_12370 [Actinobacteria bacterium 13_2_20CM_2_66_6]
MFDIAPDHAIGLYAGVLALPFALLAIRLRSAARAVPGTVLAASVLMAIAGAIHLGLVWTHRDETITALLFALNGVSYIVLSQLYTRRWWRPASVGLITATLFGYLGYIVLNFDTPDQVAVATKLLELTTLGMVLVPTQGETRKRRSRWTLLGVAVPLLTVVTVAVVWIDDLARPDALHAHAGAVLQAANDTATPEQVAAAKKLYDETAAAITPYRDWHAAWAAGYRPGPQNTPSTHWMNQRYVDAGYVMDPRHPQGLVYANTKHGPVLLGAMFQMPHIGQFGPDPGGPLTAWHQHENICFTPFGFEFSLMTPTATCPLGSIDLSVPPMLHVWIVDNPGGPFAVDIDSKVVKQIDQS